MKLLFDCHVLVGKQYSAARDNLAPSTKTSGQIVIFLTLLPVISFIRIISSALRDCEGLSLMIFMCDQSWAGAA